ncbi:GrpE-domain-containing protein [Cryphonectria parasitica EP155]|uniref:GrpE protein homolog n=1 Tax=Cryphonectria parasitica (strain ATCC 38755 / EP155) TaxID=660469 RepID=A0A9P4Y3L1_CRYP1|nr:GrpE-domain-containing protein [Cryphonectria parasitica EP155]KAF3765899.1 GrpE-domain-containing protein [Cryphonectria parasitica EP155]
MLRQALVAPSRALRSTSRSLANQRLFCPPQTFVAPIAVRRIQPAAARWYSEAVKDEQKNGDAETKPSAESPESTSEPAEDAAVTELKKKLETKEKEAADWKDKCLRSIADFRNLQDRTQREVKNAREFAIQSFAKDLVDSVDNLDRALSMVPAAKLASDEKSDDLKDLVNLYEGLKMTDDILMNTIKKHGLERFDPTGEKFNPNEHEATFMSPQEGKEDNTVFYVQQKGFKLNNRVLRAAKVGVVKNK